MSTVIGTTGLKAYNDSIRHTVPEIVDDLRLALGAKLVAYIAGVSETRTIREWAEAARRPTPAAEDRLRLVHRIVTLISQSEGQAVVPTWFQGMNPRPRRGERLRRRLMAGTRLVVFEVDRALISR